MILYPNLYIENILKINDEIIKKYNIKAFLLDLDNTILFYDGKMLNGMLNWIEEMKKIGIKFCILSNSNKKNKVENVSKILDIPYVYFAKKPFKKGFKKALEIVKEKPQNVGMIGDQIFTDIFGANRMKIFSILTKPLEKKDIFVTRIKRPIEEHIIKVYVKKRGK